jgi:hypothetical protein
VTTTLVIPLGAYSILYVDHHDCLDLCMRIDIRPSSINIQDQLIFH